MKWYIGNIWNWERKGLRKEVLDIAFQQLVKPSEASTVFITIENVQNLNDRSSTYLISDKCGQRQQLKMGTALTPIDYYVELIVRQMILGEKSRCFIKTKSGEEISFVATLDEISESRDMFTLKVTEIFEKAQQYKENGVAMFKDYPRFAHEYFARAAKLLISYKPFDNLTTKNDGVEGKDLEALFINLQTNLAACLLHQKRFEDVVYQTQFVETKNDPTEKSVYRRAVAYYNINEFESAIKTMEKIPNYQEKKDFAKLHSKIMESWKISNNQYKNVVQRMFS